jgi:hypothetical protein
MYSIYEFLSLTIFVFASILTLVSNILTCLIFFNQTNRLCRPKLLLGNIAVSDLLYIFGFIAPFFIATPNKVTTDIWIIQLIESVMNYLIARSEYSQSITMTVISYDRYYKIVKQLHINPFDRYSGKTWLLLIWALSLVLALPFVPTFDIYTFNYNTLSVDCIHLNYWLFNGTLVNYCKYNDFNYYTLSTRFLLAYLLPLIITLNNYNKICHKLSNNSTINAQISTIIIDNDNNNKINKQRNTIIMLMTIVIAFAVLRIPFYIMVIIPLIKNMQVCSVYEFEPNSYIFDYFYIICCLINPFIYWWFSKSFRDNYKNYFLLALNRIFNKF